MLSQIEGSQAVARAIARCRPEVIAAYPISPQTHIVEGLSDMVRSGELRSEYLMVESEFAAMSACIGASAAGARAYTATASQGLLFMAEALFNAPEHPYTWGLLGSMPRFDRPPTERLLPIKGTPPSLIRVPPGCAFNPRCEFSDRVRGDACTTERPELLPAGSGAGAHVGHGAACHLPTAERQQIWAQEISPRLA